MASKDELILKATLKGHTGWVTQIAVSQPYPNVILSSSRDKTLILWKLNEDGTDGIPEKRFHGHSHFITDVVVSIDGQYALSGSWDKTLRLWDLNLGRCSPVSTGLDCEPRCNVLIDSSFSLSPYSVASLEQARPPGDSKTTPRMFYLLHSRRTTVRSCPVPETRRSSCGTR